jgi:hypothetical protein
MEAVRYPIFQRGTIMQRVENLKELFIRYNLPNPEKISEEEAVARLRELNEAIEVIETQLDKKQSPQPWQDPSQFIEWRERAEKAKWVKEHQKTLLMRFIESKRVDSPQHEGTAHPRGQEFKMSLDPGSDFSLEAYKFYLLRSYQVFSSLKMEVDLTDSELLFVQELESFLARNKII